MMYKIIIDFVPIRSSREHASIWGILSSETKVVRFVEYLLACTAYFIIEDSVSELIRDFEFEVRGSYGFRGISEEFFKSHWWPCILRVPCSDFTRDFFLKCVVISLDKVYLVPHTYIVDAYASCVLCVSHVAFIVRLLSHAYLPLIARINLLFVSAPFSVFQRIYSSASSLP